MSGYSPEAPRIDASVEYPQHMVLWRNEENCQYFGEPFHPCRQTRVLLPNSVDPIETARYEPFHLDLHRLQFYLEL